METLDLIAHLEGELKATVRLLPVSHDGQFWRLDISLFHDGHPTGKLSFNLNGYNREEAESIARNIKQHPFLMKEIDEYLWGESD